MDREALAQLAATDIHAALPPEDAEKALSSPPFIPIPSALNLRDLGLAAPATIKPGLIFRSGALTTWPASSRALLFSQYGIKTIFDLRHERERTRMPSPEIAGIETVWLPPTTAPSPLTLEKFAANGGVDGFADMYEEVATIYAPAFARVFAHIVARPREPLLFHCTAGKDRTGTLAALIERLAGAADDVVAADYALTRIGVEPGREMLTGILQSAFGGVGIETPGFKELSSCEGGYVLAFLRRVEERWGGVEGYLKGVLGLTGEEVEMVKRNIAA
ncbi:hypothetical protein NA57DRAFT_54384 [Rhizodiscina lignyota]|uniref:Tyrosine specific protein phosphatases domain-containing protein n=1 Tax=Rhizodiscina lignyota TaxID=1504668 RepID=A0A9P4IKT0_9PEZI|nr:hypothetical protein NA57DRAFT_54384 [Rhizodiscina lignyota]